MYPPPQQPPPQKVDSITIPVGPRLGGKVVEAKGLSKAFGDRLLVDGLSFSIPPGKLLPPPNGPVLNDIGGASQAFGPRKGRTAVW